MAKKPVDPAAVAQRKQQRVEFVQGHPALRPEEARQQFYVQTRSAELTAAGKEVDKAALRQKFQSGGVTREGFYTPGDIKRIAVNNGSLAEQNTSKSTPAVPVPAVPGSTTNTVTPKIPAKNVSTNRTDASGNTGMGATKPSEKKTVSPTQNFKKVSNWSEGKTKKSSIPVQSRQSPNQMHVRQPNKVGVELQQNRATNQNMLNQLVQKYGQEKGSAMFSTITPLSEDVNYLSKSKTGRFFVDTGKELFGMTGIPSIKQGIKEGGFTSLKGTRDIAIGAISLGMLIKGGIEQSGLKSWAESTPGSRIQAKITNKPNTFVESIQPSIKPGIGESGAAGKSPLTNDIYSPPKISSSAGTEKIGPKTVSRFETLGESIKPVEIKTGPVTLRPETVTESGLVIPAETRPRTSIPKAERLVVPDRITQEPGSLHDVKQAKLQEAADAVLSGKTTAPKTKVKTPTTKSVLEPSLDEPFTHGPADLETSPMPAMPGTEPAWLTKQKADLAAGAKVEPKTPTVSSPSAVDAKTGLFDPDKVPPTKAGWEQLQSYNTDVTGPRVSSGKSAGREGADPRQVVLQKGAAERHDTLINTMQKLIGKEQAGDFTPLDLTGVSVPGVKTSAKTPTPFEPFIGPIQPNESLRPVKTSKLTPAEMEARFAKKSKLGEKNAQPLGGKKSKPFLIEQKKK